MHLVVPMDGIELESTQKEKKTEYNTNLKNKKEKRKEKKAKEKKRKERKAPRSKKTGMSLGSLV